MKGVMAHRAFRGVSEGREKNSAALKLKGHTQSSRKKYSLESVRGEIIDEAAIAATMKSGLVPTIYLFVTEKTREKNKRKKEEVSSQEN